MNGEKLREDDYMGGGGGELSHPADPAGWEGNGQEIDVVISVIVLIAQTNCSNQMFSLNGSSGPILKTPS